MTATLLLLLSQAERPDDPPAGAMGPLLPASMLVRHEDRDTLSDWGQLVRALELGSDASPVGLRPGAFASLGLGVDHVR